jgi:hypothetical protein
MKLAQLAGQVISDAQIKTTDEFKALSKRADEVPAINACRMVLRGDHNDVADALLRVRMQAQVAHTFRRELVDQTMTWVPSGPSQGRVKAGDDFVKLILDDGTFAVKPWTTLNCWEAVLVAGILDGRFKSLDFLQRAYASKGPDFEHDLVTRLMSGVAHQFDPTRSAGLPLPGDIVLFDGLSHVVMATGVVRIGPVGGTEVISFWPAPAQTNFGPRTQTTVEFTTIEALDAWWATNNGARPTVTFGAPNWSDIGG